MARKSRKPENCATGGTISDTKNDTNFEIKVYKTAIYARLSSDSQKNEVIETQIEICKDYISQHNFIFNLQEIYADNGFTGTNFERPDFKRMIEDVKQHNIECIIVKDLSRFGRNYIEVGKYLEQIFPFLGVRFISIMDCYDNTNLKTEEYFVTQFKTFAHAVYALETSKKVGDAYKKMQENGQFAAGNPPYGYIRSPSNPHKLIIDENIRPIIVEIFERIANGENQTSIAEDLSRRKIPTPKGKSTEWTKLNVNLIYRKEIYIGTLIFRKKTQSFYKNEVPKTQPKKTWLRHENAVPAIISQELWDKAHAVVAASRRGQKK